MAMAVPTPIDRVAVKLTSTTGICRVAGSREIEAPKRHQISPLSDQWSCGLTTTSSLRLLIEVP